MCMKDPQQSTYTPKQSELQDYQKWKKTNIE